MRFFSFDNAIQESRARGNNAVRRTNSDSTTLSDALGLDTGLVTFSLPGNAFVPGAMADSLTSFGGYIFENSGQTPLLAFLEAGASGSYGTVIEPCNYTYKFPDPMVYFFQNRGFCLAEAYYQSLSNPYQGLMAGEPLSAPFARPGEAQWISPAEGSVLSGLASFNLSFSAADSHLPLAQVDLFVDGNFVETVTNLPPTPGNILSVTIGGVAVSYTVTNGDSLGSVALGLASALTAQTNATAVQAEAVGDRLVLRSQNVTVLGSQISLQTKTAPGAAPALTTFATQIMPAFLDSTAYGYHMVQTGTNVNAGDWLQLTFIKTNGVQITVAATNTQAGAPISSFLQALMNQINANPDLQTADGANASDLLDLGTNYGFLIYAASPGWQAAQIQASFTGSTNLDPTPAGFNMLEDNLPDLQPRAHVYLSSGAASLPVQFTLNTTHYADGYHDLTAVAYEGTSVRTQTIAKRTVQFRNTTLSASLAAFAASANGDLSFVIAANATNIARIELFSTGGLVAAATNGPPRNCRRRQPSSALGSTPSPPSSRMPKAANIKPPRFGSNCPLCKSVSRAGTDPFLDGHRRAAVQHFDDNQSGNPFQPAGTVLATNGQAQWSIPAPQASAAFYRVAVAPY